MQRRNFLKTAAAGAALAVTGPTILGAADKAGSKTAVVGTGEHRYECVHNWGELPPDFQWQTTHGVCVDAAGRHDALLDVAAPLPFAITAAGYVEKYGPDERYNYLRFVGGLSCPALVTFGEIEVANNMAFAGAPEELTRLAARYPRLRTEVIEGADHFYSGVREAVVARVEAWLREALR